SLRYAGLIADNSNEQVGNRRCTHFPKLHKSTSFDTIEHQHRASEYLPFIHWFQCSRRRDLIGSDSHFQITRLELFHAATEHDSPTVNEHQVRQDVLQLFHLMCRHHDRPGPVEVVVQQRIVKLLTKQNVEPKRRLVEHQQSRINGHHQRKMKLCHHALR